MFEGERCPVRYVGGTGIEWVCIKPPHDIGLKKHQHYFVPKRPNREKNMD